MYGGTPFVAAVLSVVALPLHMVDELAVIAPESIVLPNTVMVSGDPAVMYKLLQGGTLR